MQHKADMESRLAESDLRLKIALRAARIGIWDWDVRTGRMTYSPRARSICGFAPDVPITIDMVRDVTHPEDLPRTSAMARRALDPELQEQETFEYRLVRADTGEVRWVLAHGEAIFAAVDGRVEAVRFIGTIEDITERKLVEEALKNAQLTQQLAVDAADMAVWEYFVEGERLTVTRELKRLYGFAEADDPALPDFRARYAPGEQARVQQAGADAIAAGNMQFEVEFRIVRLDGVERWMLLRAQILCRADGAYERVLGIVMDIDARKRANEQRELMLRELAHRVKNSLAVVAALASQTFREATTVAEALPVFRARIQALALANDVLVDEDWKGFGLKALVERVTSPYREDGHDPFLVEGPEATLRASANVPLALVLHELCTNAAKYGALSVPAGRVRIEWQPVEAGHRFVWTEENGPPVGRATTAAESGGTGFGMTLMTKVLAREFVHFDYHLASEGVRCEIVV